MKDTFMSKPSVLLQERCNLSVFLELDGELSQGRWVEKFEEELALRLGYPRQNIVAVSSGTAALHLAYEILKPDKVTMPAMTFISTGNMARQAGVKVEFVDIDPHTWNVVDADVSVDLFGNPAGRECLIEDAAEAFGSHHFARPCGTLGRIGILSFFANKIITTGGEGGALICKYEEDARQAFLLRQQGKDFAMMHASVPGYNYRMTEIQAAFGCAQLSHLVNEIDMKRSIFQEYYDQLHGSVEFQKEYGYSNRWLTAIKLPSEKCKDELVEKFTLEKIPWVNPFYPLYRHPWLYAVEMHLPETEDLWKKGICLPSSFRGDYKPKVDFICDLIVETIYR